MSDSATGSVRDSAVERRRAREDRGMAPAAAARGDRLPPPPRERRPLLAALAVLLIVGGAAIAGLLALRMDTRVPVLVAAHDIDNGQLITAADLTSVPVAYDSANLVPTAQLDSVLDTYANVPISAGQLLDESMLTSASLLRPGTVAVGASLAAGRMPASGLEPGDVVQLVRVVDAVGTVIVPDALVSSAYASGDAEFTGTSGAVVTFIVGAADGASIAAVAADGSLAAVLVSRGEARD